MHIWANKGSERLLVLSWLRSSVKFLGFLRYLTATFMGFLRYFIIFRKSTIDVALDVYAHTLIGRMTSY